MSFGIKEYSASDVILTFGGAVVEGWNSIRVKRNAPSFRLIEGIRDKNTRTRVGNSSATVEIDLVQTSDINYVFSEILRQDEMYGTGRIELMLRDIMSGETFSSSKAFISAYADISFEGDIAGRTWIIHCLNSQTGHGSSGDVVGSFVERISRMF